MLTVLVINARASGGDEYKSYIPFSTANNCLNWPNAVPAAALPGQPPPVFCLINAYGPATDEEGPNYWSDDFDHGLSLATFDGTGYKTYDEIGAWRTIFWRHAEHWMVDIAPHPQNTSYGWNRGYTMLRPDRTFKFENGKLVVETTVAAGHEGYDEKAWPEIVISTGPTPYQEPVALYGYDQFPQHWTLGCRLQSSRVPICALKANNGTPPQGSGQIWETAFWLPIGSHTFGGFPGGGLENLWRECEVTDPDLVCRDHFRLELTKTSLKLFVNGGLYFEQSGLPAQYALPDAFVNGNLYVYLVSSQVNHPADTIRYHWDNFFINPPQSAAKQDIEFSSVNENICLIPSNKTSSAGLSLNRSRQLQP